MPLIQTRFVESLILTVSSFLIGGTILFFYAKSLYAPKDQLQKVNELVEEIKVLKEKNPKPAPNLAENLAGIL